MDKFISFAILGAILIGSALVPWNIATADRKVDIGSFTIALGIAFIVSGFVLKALVPAGESIFLPGNLRISGLAISTYALGMMFITITIKLANPQTMPIASTIFATYLIPMVVTNAVVNSTLPNARVGMFMLLTLIGIAGVSYFGEH